MISKKTLILLSAIVLTANVSTVAVGQNLDNRYLSDNVSEDYKMFEVSVDNEIVNDDSETIIKKEGDNVHFVVDTKLSDYKLYIGSNLVECNKDNINSFDYKFEESGQYVALITAKDPETQEEYQKSIKISVRANLDYGAKINDISIYRTQSGDILAAVSCRGNDLKYKYEIMDKRYDSDFENKEFVNDFQDISNGYIKSNNIILNVMKSLDESDHYYLRVTAEDGCGVIDVKDIPFSPEPSNYSTIDKLDMAINDEEVTKKFASLNCASEIEFKGKPGYENYQLYRDDELVASSNSYNNVVKWKVQGGFYNFKFIAFNNPDKDGNMSILENDINLTINDKEQGAPNINSVSISSDESSDEISCIINADGDNNQYKVEALYSDLDKKYEDFNSFKLISDYSDSNTIKWSDEKSSKLSEKQSNIRKVKITVKNEKGTDCVILDCNENLEFKRGQLLNQKSLISRVIVNNDYISESGTNIFATPTDNIFIKVIPMNLEDYEYSIKVDGEEISNKNELYYKVQDHAFELEVTIKDKFGNYDTKKYNMEQGMYVEPMFVSIENVTCNGIELSDIDENNINSNSLKFDSDYCCADKCSYIYELDGKEISNEQAFSIDNLYGKHTLKVTVKNSENMSDTKEYTIILPEKEEVSTVTPSDSDVSTKTPVEEKGEEATITPNDGENQEIVKNPEDEENNKISDDNKSATKTPDGSNNQNTVPNSDEVLVNDDVLDSSEIKQETDKSDKDNGSTNSSDGFNLVFIFTMLIGLIASVKLKFKKIR